MIDIEIKALTEEELEQLTTMSFSWQPDITSTRLRLYGSAALMQDLALDIKDLHPEYDIVTVM
jgi:hypothetical protein